MKVTYDLVPESNRQHLPKDQSSLGFGRLRTNHMFVADFYDGAWHDPRIVPYGPFAIPPGAVALHYGQTIFEGGKAFLHKDGELYIFRYDHNIARLNTSAEIICMPPVPEDLHWEGINRLLDLERDWCPTAPQSSLYIRPFMFATSDDLAVHASTRYTFCIMVSPSGPYYSGGFSSTVNLLVSNSYHRAVAGGTGEAKTGGNYAASLRATDAAALMGCAQVLYLDATNKYVEEAGAMNHFHVLKDGTFVIPRFNGTILRSITSRSVLELAAMGRLKARQEEISLQNLTDGIRRGDIIEAGGFGTAAVVSPVGKYVFEDGSELLIGNGKPGAFSTELYTMYTGFQTGDIPAPEGWLRQVPRF